VPVLVKRYPTLLPPPNPASKQFVEIALGTPEVIPTRTLPETFAVVARPRSVGRTPLFSAGRRCGTAEYVDEMMK